MDFITIIQGDDTNFLEDQFVVVNFNTSIDLSGFTATFTLGNVTLTYGNLSGKTFEIILSNEITSNLKIGKQYGELKLIDNNNRIRTVSSIIPFIVKKGVDEQITFVNSSLNVTMNINDTVIDIFVETSGISKTEAQRILASCRDSEQAASNYSNTAQNALISVNQTVSAFQQDFSDLSEQLENAQTIYDNSISHIETVTNQKIALATAQADRAETKAEEVYSILENSSDSDLTKLSSVGLNKINQTKALETGNISSDVNIYNKILEYKQKKVKTGVDILEQNYKVYSSSAPLLDGSVEVLESGLTSGLTNDNCYITVPVEISSAQQTPFNVHIECIIKDLTGGYIAYSQQNAIGIQIQYGGKLTLYMYANDGNTKLFETQTLNPSIGDRCIIDVGYNETDNFYCRASCNDITVENSTNIGTAWIRESIESFWYGRCSHSYDCSVDVDLLHSYFEVDCKKIRPLVQIPYCLSPTGSKIADADSRDFIQEIYEKEGFANYYTIDEVNQNFTLPMGEIYGMINKSLEPLANKKLELDDTQIASLMNAIAPDTNVRVGIHTTPTSSSTAYVPNCAGWYVICADVTAKRYLYINGKQTPYCLPTTNSLVSVFLSKGDSVYWNGALGTIHSHTFLPAKGCKYKKTSQEELDDLFG